MTNIAMENGHVYWVFSLKNGGFAIVMLVYQRVKPCKILQQISNHLYPALTGGEAVVLEACLATRESGA